MIDDDRCSSVIKSICAGEICPPIRPMGGTRSKPIAPGTTSALPKEQSRSPKATRRDIEAVKNNSLDIPNFDVEVRRIRRDTVPDYRHFSLERHATPHHATTLTYIQAPLRNSKNSFLAPSPHQSRHASSSGSIIRLSWQKRLAQLRSYGILSKRAIETTPRIPSEVDSLCWMLLGRVMFLSRF